MGVRAVVAFFIGVAYALPAYFLLVDPLTGFDAVRAWCVCGFDGASGHSRFALQSLHLVGALLLFVALAHVFSALSGSLDAQRVVLRVDVVVSAASAALWYPMYVRPERFSFTNELVPAAALAANGAIATLALVFGVLLAGGARRRQQSSGALAVPKPKKSE